MTELTLALEIIKNIGFPAVIFIVWYVYHKAQVESYRQILHEQAEREKRNYDLLKEMVDTAQLQTAILSRVETKLEAGYGCTFKPGDWKK